MTGRHEPESRGSFWFSLTTAALRGVLVVAAVVLGVFVLSRAFPSTGGSLPSGETPGGAGTAQTESPGEDVQTPSPRQPQDPGNVTIQVLNGTDVDGLAADTQALLEDEGYKVVTVGDARARAQTTIFYAPRAKVDAEILMQQIFPDAALEEGAQDVDADITVILGDDWAAEFEAMQAEETPSPEES